MKETHDGGGFGIEIDLQKLLLRYLSKWWLILLCGVVTAAIALAYTLMFIPYQYTTSVTVYVNSTKTVSEDSQSVGNLGGAARVVTTYVNIIKSNTVLEEVAAQLNMEGITAGYIRGCMSATQVGGTEMFSINVTDNDPERAAQIANTIAEVAPGQIEHFVVGSSTKIIDYAKVPTSPSSPDVKGNVLKGGAAGAVVVVAVLTVLCLLDVRIKDEDDLNHLFDLPVLGQIPEISQHTSSSRRGYEAGKEERKGRLLGRKKSENAYETAISAGDKAESAPEVLEETGEKPVSEVSEDTVAEPAAETGKESEAETSERGSRNEDEEAD